MDVRQDINNTDWMIFVGKWGDAAVGHPLVYHLLDSAAVAGQLWERGLTQGSREQFSAWLRLPEMDCGRLLAFWTSLHDLGKATPSFQAKHAPTKDLLESRGYSFPDLPKGDVCHHSLLSQWILEDFAAELDISPLGRFNQFRFAIGGHHGTFHTNQRRESSANVSENLGDARWEHTRRELFLSLRDLFTPPSLPEMKLSQTDRNAFFNLLTGFFVTADWISSQDDLFQYHPEIVSLEEYWQKSQTLAEEALRRTGWVGWQPDGTCPEFSDMFGFSPHPLQKTILKYAEKLKGPFLMIIEAPTGCGKTEAALMAGDRSIQSGKLRGCYIAMPTQATSNQMFGRTRAFLEKRYPGQDHINLQLVHGSAILNQDFQQLRLSAVSDEESDRNRTEDGNVNAMEWFLPRKRTLLAPFGVGTVDQTFTSVLRAKHHFLRLFGLSRKMVIFDEVHAYDTYMTEIFCRLLAWLRAMGSPVIVLSATLPQETRLELLKAYQPQVKFVTTEADYPRLSINDGQAVYTISLDKFSGRKVHLKEIRYDPQKWIADLRGILCDGGCAAVICNTVDRAQEVYQQIRDAGLVDDSDLFLLHARMPFCWRKQREDDILQRFGKREHPEARPRRGIVVATQVIEQSLDLDFDLLITDLAPVDLLIQRIGRLQRHTGSEKAPVRPAGLSEANCWVCCPEPVEDALPVFGSDQCVYVPAILQRTYFVLEDRENLSLPEESDCLINQVYSDKPLKMCSPIQNQEIDLLYRKMLKKQSDDSILAENRLVDDVDEMDGLGGKTEYLRDDDQSTGETTRALTRNIILPSVQLVCFVKKDGCTCLLDGETPFDPERVPYGKHLEQALRSVVNVSTREVVDYFYAQGLHEAWRTCPALRHAHPILFDERGTFDLRNGVMLTLDEKKGLCIEKKKSGKNE
jgi:CRISPR-associated endonuclease/helicase Cas3